MFEYFYHEILRKTIISFGTLFNGITIKHSDSDGDVGSVIRVPLAYGPTQKFLARLEQQPDLNKSTQITLPRMSFEFIGLTYDPSRKVTTTQTFISGADSSKSTEKKTYMPVPYNMNFELSLMCKLNDDALQIVEQILPYFQPAYALSVDLVESIGEKRDIPVILENITMDDQYEGDFSTRRVLLYTLRFSAKTYLFGPVSSAATDIIKKVSIGYIAADSSGADSRTGGRDLTYTVTPRATKNYDGVVATNLSNDISLADTTFDVNSGSSLTKETYIVIDNESMYVEKINSNQITVVRGQDGTTAAAHVSGADIGTITSDDNDLIEVGDDFGFSGSYS
jgi:hypothetical protein|tara:strand:+ start:1397 stop:2410 length:1014 start_codon:yes stop_codon:yes gene_type:complete